MSAKTAKTTKAPAKSQRAVPNHTATAQSASRTARPASAQSASRASQPYRKPRKTPAQFFASLFDRLALAGHAGLELIKRPSSLAIFVLAFVFFLYFLTFFKHGPVYWHLLWSGLPFDKKLAMLGHVFELMFVNFESAYGLFIVFMSLFQALCIMLLVFAWKNREKNRTLDGAGTGGIGAVLGFLALGCPSCGVTFVTPILTAIAGAGAAALTESVSQIFMVLAFVLLFYSVAQLGYVDYVILTAQKYERKHGKKENH